MHILNVAVCVKEFVFPSIYSVLVYHWYINANMGLWWVVSQLNIFPTLEQANTMITIFYL